MILALSNGHEVVCLKRKGSSPVIELNKQPTWVEGDLNSNYYNYFKGCDVLVHFASCGVSPQKAPLEKLYEVNTHQSFSLYIKCNFYEY